MPSSRRIRSLAWRALRYEVSLYVSLLRWIVRRPSVQAGEQPIGYARLVTPVMSLWIFGSAVEVPVVHLLLPWDSIRMIVLGLGIWGLIWMLGALASLRVHPHVMTAEALVVRHGPHIRITVPWSSIADVRAVRRDLPSSMRTLHQVGDQLAVGVSGETNVDLVLAAPMTATLPGGSRTFSTLSLLVDEPRELVAEVRQRSLRPKNAAASPQTIATQSAVQQR